MGTTEGGISVIVEEAKPEGDGYLLIIGDQYYYQQLIF